MHDIREGCHGELWVFGFVGFAGKALDLGMVELKLLDCHSHLHLQCHLGASRHLAHELDRSHVSGLLDLVITNRINE